MQNFIKIGLTVRGEGNRQVKEENRLGHPLEKCKHHY
jgi:hypothetical protein